MASSYRPAASVVVLNFPPPVYTTTSFSPCPVVLSNTTPVMSERGVAALEESAWLLFAAAESAAAMDPGAPAIDDVAFVPAGREVPPTSWNPTSVSRTAAAAPASADRTCETRGSLMYQLGTIHCPPGSC